MPPRVLDYGIDPSTKGMTVRREADGSINIDIRPGGILGALGFAGRPRWPWLTGIMLVITIAGAVSPLVIGYLYMPGPFRWLMFFCYGMMIGLLAVVLYPSSRRHVSIYASADGLVVHAHDPVETRRHQWRREEIKDIRTAMPSTPEHDPRHLEMQVVLADKHVSFLDHLPANQVRDVVNLLRETLGLDPHAPSSQDTTS